MIPYEINDPNAKMLIVGRDPGSIEMKEGRPFVGPAGKVLDAALFDAGIDRSEINVANVVNTQPPGNVFANHNPTDIDTGLSKLNTHISGSSYNLIMAFGNEAAYATIPDWPSKSGTIHGASSILDRRGYVFEGYHGVKVIAIVHPAATIRQWVPWRILTTVDLVKAKREATHAAIRRPPRILDIVNDRKSANRILQTYADASRVAADIELTDRGNGLGCIGFSKDGASGHVFSGSAIADALDFLHRPPKGTRIVWCNGQFDLHFLATRIGVRCGGVIDDVQLAWHSCYPELAGASIDKSGKRKGKFTRKALSFLASVYTNDAWWKDYNFSTARDKYYLNAVDVCATYDIMQELDTVIDNLGVRNIYTHATNMVWPVVDMQSRGILINNDLRKKRIRQLRKARKTHQATVQQIALPLIKARADAGKLPHAHLFQEKFTCPCCKGGKVKVKECWSCAGYDAKPTKTQLNADGITLTTCTACNGVGKWTKLTFNPRSTHQKKVLLYDILKFRKRKSKGKVSVDEEKLRDMLTETL